MDFFTAGMAVFSVVALVTGFAISLRQALKESDRVTITVDGEVMEVRRSHAREDMQNVLSRLIRDQPRAGASAKAPSQLPPRNLLH